MADLKKVFRDPIYNLISFDKKEDKPLLDIVNTPEFQRLRRIRQLGLSSYTYPTAVHDRFSHSLGVAHIVGIFFDNLNTPEIVNVLSQDGEHVELHRKQVRLLLQLAGLLHDIGHGPFSHAFEKITSVDHEEMSKKIILDKNGNIYPILTSIDDVILANNSPSWIVEIITGGTFEPIWIKEMISSQLDADRIDYLLRDAYMCGVNYASFDFKWLFQNIEIGKIKNEGNRDGLLVNAKKGIHAVEAFIVSRYHMYEQVYFHKTTRCFELVIQMIFKRLKDLITEGDNIEKFFINNNFLAFINDNNNLKAFLSLDDFSLYTHFNHWIENKFDSILEELCSTLLYRKPYKLIREVENDSLTEHKTRNKITEYFKNKGKEEDFYFFEDKYSNIPYKDTYLLGKKSSEDASHIWLKDTNGQLKEFAEVSPIISSLRNKELKKRRGYVHRDFLKEIEEILTD